MVDRDQVDSILAMPATVCALAPLLQKVVSDGLGNLSRSRSFDPEVIES
jgi:hypothetical protein